jgi:hypothetical protein
MASSADERADGQLVLCPAIVGRIADCGLSAVVACAISISNGHESRHEHPPRGHRGLHYRRGGQPRLPDLLCARTRCRPGVASEVDAIGFVLDSRNDGSRPSAKTLLLCRCRSCMIGGVSSLVPHTPARDGGCCTNPRRARWSLSKGGVEKAASRRPPRGARCPASALPAPSACVTASAAQVFVDGFVQQLREHGVVLRRLLHRRHSSRDAENAAREGKDDLVRITRSLEVEYHVLERLERGARWVAWCDATN